MDLSQTIAIFAVILTNLTTVIVLFCDNKSERLISAMREDVKAIHEEMKDFHGRLCSIQENIKG